MSEKLKPCWKCGRNEGSVREISYDMDRRERGYRVRCMWCGDVTAFYMKRSLAVAAWNRRAPRPDAGKGRRKP